MKHTYIQQDASRLREELTKKLQGIWNVFNAPDFMGSRAELLDDAAHVLGKLQALAILEAEKFPSQEELH